MEENAKDPENQNIQETENQEPQTEESPESTQEQDQPDTPEEAASQEDTPPENETQEDQEPAEPVCNKTAPKKAFVVLCEREKINKDILDALDKLGINPIILYPDNPEQTIEQKLMSHPQVSFSCVILAGDDFIYDRQNGKPADAVLGAKSSAVFHCAYLCGKFGRMNTFILYRAQDAFHLPTTMHNAIFTPYEPRGRWPELLESRLREAGIL